MRIAVLTSSYPRFDGDGTAPFVQSISEHLVKQGHEVCIVAPHDQAVDQVTQSALNVHRFRYIWPERWHIMGHARSLEADVRIRPLAFLLLPLFLLAQFIKLWQITGQQDSQLIHAHWVLPNGPVAALVARLRQIPLVVSLHGSDMYVARKNNFFGLAARLVFRRASAVTAPSEELKQAAIKIWPQSKIHLLTWGADPQIFHSRPNNPALRNSLGLNNEQTVILTIGRMVYKKGFDILIEAWATLAGQYPQHRLVIAGDGPLRIELTKLIEQDNLTDSVFLPGEISWHMVPEYLSLARIFVLPSVLDRSGNLDGLPTVLLEAMSCGIPVIASHLAGIPEIIEDGQNGLLFPAGDSQALARKLVYLLDNPSAGERLGHAARDTILREHNWNRVARNLTEIFDASQ